MVTSGKSKKSDKNKHINTSLALSLINPTSEICSGAQGGEGNYLLVKEGKEVREKEERFKFHLKADWKFTQKIKRRGASQTEGPLRKNKAESQCHGAFEEM